MSKKQTAVEWLYNQLNDYDFTDLKNNDYYEFKIPVYVLKEKIDQAKAIEKEQIIDAVNEGIKQGYEDYIDTEWGRDNDYSSEQYYNETYGND